MEEIRSGTQGRNREAESEAEASERHGLLACPLQVALLVFFYSQGSPAQGGIARREWARSHQSTKKMQQGSPKGQSGGGDSLTEVPTSQTILVWVRLTNLTSTDSREGKK